jgi:hypothetical protein
MTSSPTPWRACCRASSVGQRGDYCEAGNLFKTSKLHQTKYAASAIPSATLMSWMISSVRLIAKVRIRLYSADRRGAWASFDDLVGAVTQAPTNHLFLVGFDWSYRPFLVSKGRMRTPGQGLLAMGSPPSIQQRVHVKTGAFASNVFHSCVSCRLILKSFSRWQQTMRWYTPARAYCRASSADRAGAWVSFDDFVGACE